MLTAIASVMKRGQLRETTARRDFRADRRGVEKRVVNLYPDVTFQTFRGFGGALTEAAGYVFAQLPAERRAEILRAYYGPGGLNYRFARTHLDSCDFSLDSYAAMNDPRDPELASFSLVRDEKYILPLIHAANAAAPEPLQVMLTPWSPPPFMKTNGTKKFGGYLKEEYYPLWARYICRYIREYRDRGVNVTMLTPQNEPKARQIWDSCLFTGEMESRFIAGHLGPELCRSGLDDVALFIWDHNKERAFDRACDVLGDGTAAPYVSGVGVHWYSGDHFEALELIGRRFPGLRLAFTEACVEYTTGGDTSPLKNAQRYAHDLIGNLNAGLDLFLDWNILLDNRGGPNHVGNFCEAPIMCDVKAGTFRLMPSYHYIGHFSRHILPGAVRIGLSRFSDELEVTAFRNPDGTLAAVVLNRGPSDVPYVLRLGGRICPLKAEALSLTTLRIEP